MKLKIGARLPHDYAEIPPNDPDVVQRNRALYRITQVLVETPWSCLYRGKKVFRNFEFSKGTLIEASDEECLDVLIRTLVYPRLDLRDEIKARREHSWFVAKKVLGCRKTNLIAEPLDYLEIRNDQDHFAFPRQGKILASEPVLVFETIHGENMVRWRQSSTVDIAGALHVLGQVLDFIGTMHCESFLLNVVSPITFWVDELHRAHFLGTENVVDEKHAAQWRELFPDERYSQGFAAPELFRANQAPTRRTDLYGWAALAWFLLTGLSPAKIAADQRQRWATFDAGHRDRLMRQLEMLSPSQIADVQRHLRVTGSRFVELWPESFLEGLWSCLGADEQLRPGSVADLRASWNNPPPPPVSTSVAVTYSNGTTRIAFTTSGDRTGLSYRISRRMAHPPRFLTDGEIVWQGTSPTSIEVTLPSRPDSHRDNARLGDWLLSIFALETVKSDAELPATRSGQFRLDKTKGISASRPTEVVRLDGTVPRFRRQFAESLSHSTESVPEAIRLLGELDSLEIVGDELLDSSEPRVRRWAVAILGEGLNNRRTHAACQQRIERRGLVDEEYEVRLTAAGALLRAMPDVDAARIADLAQQMGRGEVDDMIRAARTFAQFGVPQEEIEAAITSLEQQHRIVNCPVCHQELRVREVDGHLQTEHGYVPLEGTLLPFGKALNKLWSRVVTQHDAASLPVLTGYLRQRLGEQSTSAFGSALAQQVLRSIQFQQPQLDQQQWLQRIAQCLQTDKMARQGCWTLLSHEDGRIRSLARDVVISDAASQLANIQVTAANVRHVVNQLAPLPIVSERIEVCQRLIQLGANPVAAEACERELELERLVDCPECGTTCTRMELARHRRLEHAIYEWEGSRYSGDALIDLLFARVVSREPDAFAARTLEELYVEQYGSRAWQLLYQGLRQRLLRDQGQHSIAANRSFGSVLGQLKTSVNMAMAFMREESPECQTAGLSIFANLDGDPPEELSWEAATLVGSEKIPHSVCQQVLVHLLRLGKFQTQQAFPGSSNGVRNSDTAISSSRQEVCRAALQAFASRAEDKLKAVDDLRALEQWVGPSDVIDAACDELLARIRLRCPRCGERLPPPELAEHVRDQHGLVLEGRSVRKPWPVAMDYLDAYADNPQPQLLERAEQLAVMAFPKSGLLKLQREALRRDAAPEHYRRAILESVKSTTESLCPECWESLPTASTPLDTVKIDDQSNITSDVVSIKNVGWSGLWASVEIAPWSGPSPPWTFVRWGAAALVGVPFLVVSALCLVLAWQGYDISLSFAFWLALIGTTIGGAAAGMSWRRKVDPVDVAWQFVVPILIDDEKRPPGLSESAFLASLANGSRGKGDAKSRQAILERAIDCTRDLVLKGLLPARHLAELWHLRLDDTFHARRLADDREAMVRQVMSRAFEGEFSLDLATQHGAVLSHLSSAELIAIFWNLISLARQHHLTAADVTELFGRSSTLVTLSRLTSLRLKSLAHYFAVLELESQGHMPGGLRTVQKLNEQGNFRGFARDVHVLAQSPPNTNSNEQIFLRAGSLEFREILFESPQSVVIKERTKFIQTGWTHQRVDGGPDRRYTNNPPLGYNQVVDYVLQVGGHTWDQRQDPSPLATKLRAAFGFCFAELEHRAQAITQQRLSRQFSTILDGPADRCPRCRISLQLRKGGVAIRNTESA